MYYSRGIGFLWYVYGTLQNWYPFFGEDKRMLYDDVFDEKAKLGILKGINTFLHDIWFSLKFYSRLDLKIWCELHWDLKAFMKCTSEFIQVDHNILQYHKSSRYFSVVIIKTFYDVGESEFIARCDKSMFILHCQKRWCQYHKNVLWYSSYGTMRYNRSWYEPFIDPPFYRPQLTVYRLYIKSIDCT